MMIQLEKLKADLQILQSIEMLEYHDKNHLAGNDKSRSREKQHLIKNILEDVEGIKAASENLKYK